MTRRLALVVSRPGPLVAALAAALLVVPGPPAAAAPPPAGEEVVMTTFGFTGAPERFVVPDGECRIYLSAIGGSGGEGSLGRPPADGGQSAYITVVVDVTPGQVLTIDVGGAGGDATGGQPGAGGYGGGAPGGDDTGTSLNDGGGGGGRTAVLDAATGGARRGDRRCSTRPPAVPSSSQEAGPGAAAVAAMAVVARVAPTACPAGTPAMPGAAAAVTGARAKVATRAPAASLVWTPTWARVEQEHLTQGRAAGAAPEACMGAVVGAPPPPSGREVGAGRATPCPGPRSTPRPRRVPAR